MPYIKTAKQIYREEGPISLLFTCIKFGYDHFVRRFLPTIVVYYNNIPVRASHLGDSVVPWHDTNIPGYEAALLKGIKKHIMPGDFVTIVGGGWGVSTVAAAEQTGDSGHVVTFEGSLDAAEKVEQTVHLNSVEGLVSVRHAVVARALSLRGDDRGAETIPPKQLPECDVLVLDCEGAEVDIIEQMEIRPRSLIVETHGMLGATEAEVRDKLTSAGYKLSASEIAEKRQRDVCEENGIYVVLAEYGY